MNRRTFLSLLGIGTAGFALERAIPNGRVWSFPKNIVCLNIPTYQQTLERLKRAYRSMYGEACDLGPSTVDGLTLSLLAQRVHETQETLFEVYRAYATENEVQRAMLLPRYS